jgi:hypothetical protein
VTRLWRNTQNPFSPSCGPRVRVKSFSFRDP